MNFKMAMPHPSGDIYKLNGYVSLNSGGGAGEKYLGISVWILSVAMGAEGM